jgi:hypothetical protein
VGESFKKIASEHSQSLVFVGNEILRHAIDILRSKSQKQRRESRRPSRRREP